MWLKTAGDHPVVVNRTIFPIYDLIRNKPTIRQHLRKTTEYYLKTGSMPTFEQLTSPLSGRSAQIVQTKPIGPIHGLDTVGCGYNILSMENKFCILDQSNFSEGEQWSDPLNQSIAYSIPDGWFAVNTPESLALDGSFVVTSVQDYFRRTTSVSVSRHTSALGLRRRQTTRTVTDFYRRFHQEYYNLIVRLKQVAWYTLAVRTFPYPKLSTIAEKAIHALPEEFSADNLTAWKDFFDVFGTHLVVSSTMGGQLWTDIWYDQCLTHERTEQWISEQTKTTWFFFFHSYQSSESHQLKIDEQFRRNSFVSLHLIGGNQTLSPFNWDQWISTVKYQPSPLSHHLVSLDELLPQSRRRTALKQAIDYVLQIAEKEDRTYINQLESVRGPPKSSCSSHGIRTRRQDAKIEQQMVQDLCPSIGYKGKECLQKTLTGRSLAGANATRVRILIRKSESKTDRLSLLFSYLLALE